MYLDEDPVPCTSFWKNGTHKEYFKHLKKVSIAIYIEMDVWITQYNNTVL